MILQSDSITEIIPLENASQHIPLLAEIWHDVLGRRWVPEISPEALIKDLHSSLNTDSLPFTWVACSGSTPVGMISLCVDDDIRPERIYSHLSDEDLKKIAWLADLVVHPKYQGARIGKELINAVIEKSRELQLKCLYLFTLDPAVPKYYEKLGWVATGTDSFHGRPITLMSFDL